LSGNLTERSPEKIPADCCPQVLACSGRVNGYKCRESRARRRGPRRLPSTLGKEGPASQGGRLNTGTLVAQEVGAKDFLDQLVMGKPDAPPRSGGNVKKIWDHSFAWLGRAARQQGVLMKGGEVFGQIAARNMEKIFGMVCRKGARAWVWSIFLGVLPIDLILGE